MQFPRTVSQAVGGIYSWLLAMYFGAVLLDIVYSSLLDSAGADTQLAYSKVSDFLLLIVGLTLLMGFVAVGFSWTNSAARNLFAASLLVLVAAGFLALLVLFPLARSSPESTILNYGPLFRLVPIGIASVIGLMGFRSLSRAGRESVVNEQERK